MFLHLYTCTYFVVQRFSHISLFDICSREGVFIIFNIFIFCYMLKIKFYVLQTTYLRERGVNNFCSAIKPRITVMYASCGSCI